MASRDPRHAMGLAVLSEQLRRTRCLSLSGEVSILKTDPIPSWLSSPHVSTLVSKHDRNQNKGDEV